MWGVLVIGALVGIVGAQSGGESLLVDIRQGPVRGYKQPDSNVFAFYGIPYATAPKGRQKYMPPLPPPEWTEPLEAVDKYVVCMQHNLPGTREDCLVANVYVPDTNGTNLPVLVSIHGGAFHSFYGGLWEPIALLNNSNMITVTFNYRLGVQGFLCLGTEEVPGNAGMKDQVALLRWVQENIASFGGNPNDVTIQGCSAGAMSAGLLTLSPAAEGLFHRVIAASGGIAGVTTAQLDPIANARNYAKQLNFDNIDDLQALEEFYKTASYETLHSGIDELVDRTDSYIPFVPCVEADLGAERFLEDAPANILRRQNLTQYPMLYGYTNMEGLFYIHRFDEWKVMMNEKFSDFLPADLEFSSEDEREEVAASVKEFYFSDEPVSESNVLSYVDFFTDVLFAYPMLRSVRMLSELGNSTIYLYEYSFVDENTPFVRNTTERGATHCAQTDSVFDEIFEANYNYTEEYFAMQETMREFYTNFVTTGSPVPAGSPLPAWPPADARRSPHMSIGPAVELLGPLSQRRADFWDEIYGKYYRTPIPPRSSAFRHMFSSYVVVAMAALFIFNT